MNAADIICSVKAVGYCLKVYKESLLKYFEYISVYSK